MATPSDYTMATLARHVGRDFGVATPQRLDQARIDAFARCTGDAQWIHTDPARARRESPAGVTIAHGLLLLALIPSAQFDLGVYPRDAASVLNYGFERVRFLAPVPEGSEVAVRVELHTVEAKSPGRYLLRCVNTAFITTDPQRPVMIADSLGMVVA